METREEAVRRTDARVIRRRPEAVQGRVPTDEFPAAASNRAARREQLVTAHLGLVDSIARRYEHLGLPREDVVQEGYLGLLAAARRFEGRPETAFSTYAAGWIRQAICRALSQQPRTIRIPLRRLELRRHVEAVAADIEQRRGNAVCDGARSIPQQESVAHELGLDLGELREAVLSTPVRESLDAVPDLAHLPVCLLPANLVAADPCDAAVACEQRECLAAAVARLPERLRTILCRRFGLVGQAETGLAELGRELGISAERVRQLQNQALGRLRRDLRSPVRRLAIRDGGQTTPDRQSRRKGRSRRPRQGLPRQRTSASTASAHFALAEECRGRAR